MIKQQNSNKNYNNNNTSNSIHNPQHFSNNNNNHSTADAGPVMVPTFANATLIVLLAGTVIFGVYFTPLADLTAASNSFHLPASEIAQILAK